MTASYNLSQLGSHYNQGGTGAVDRTTASKLQESVSVLDFGADPTGATDCSTAFNNALTASANVVVPPGTYLVSSTINLSSTKTINFLGGASILAGANSLTVFLAASTAYGTQIWNPVVKGNGKTGVVAFDMTNFRAQAGIYNALVSSCNNGFIFRTGCYATALVNPTVSQTPYPVQLISNDGSLDIINPIFDNEPGNGGSGTGIGVDVQTSGSPTIGSRITGGYIQGFQYGVKDAAYATKVEDVYFEVNTSADIYGVGAKYSIYSNTTHFGTSASAYAFTLSSCDSVTIFNPAMGSSNRLALYNVDSTNTNCVEYHTVSAIAIDTPIGSLTYLSSIPKQTTTTFTPVVSGTSTAGTGTYTTQSGTVVQTGNTVHVQMEITWTAHTGTGNTVITGIPTTFTPASFTPRRVALVIPAFAVTGPIVYGYLNGSTTNITLAQVVAAGTQSLVPLASSGTLYLNLVYDL
jgi:Pectate lyase superfamily protein